MEKNNEKQLPNKIIFNVTENIKKLGISELNLEKRDFLITWSDGRNSCIDFTFRHNSFSPNIKLIERTIKKEAKKIRR